MRLERRERAGLVDAHEAAVADHIGGQNSGQTAFHVLRSPPRYGRLA